MKTFCSPRRSSSLEQNDQFTWTNNWWKLHFSDQGRSKGFASANLYIYNLLQKVIRGSLRLLPHYTSWYLLAQSQQLEHQNNEWHLFIIKIKATRSTSTTSFWCLFCSDLTYCSGVSIVDLSKYQLGCRSLFYLVTFFKP